MTITLTIVIEAPDRLEDVVDSDDFRDEIEDAVGVAFEDATEEEPEDIIVRVDIDLEDD